MGKIMRTDLLEEHIERLEKRIEELKEEVTIAENSRERAIDHMKIFQKNYNQERKKNKPYRKGLNKLRDVMEHYHIDHETKEEVIDTLDEVLLNIYSEGEPHDRN